MAIEHEIEILKQKKKETIRENDVNISLSRARRIQWQDQAMLCRFARRLMPSAHTNERKTEK